MTVSIYQHCYRPSLYTLAIVLSLVIGLVPISAAQTTAVSSAEKADAAQDTTLPEVVVSGTKEKKVAPKEGSAESGYRNRVSTVGPLGDLRNLDTPYSINSTSGELIENREAHTEYDALIMNPSVSNLASPTSSSVLSRVMVRGFTAADQGDFRDGLVDRSFTYVPLESIERIDVLNGLSGFLNGFSAKGGTINYVSKPPVITPLARVSYGNYGGGLNYIHFDLGGAFPFTGKKLATRLNAYREQGSTYVNGGTQWRTFLSGSSSYQLLPNTRMKVASYFQDFSQHGQSITFDATNSNWTLYKIDVPDASLFDATVQYGQSFTWNRSRKTIVDIGLDSRLNKVFSLRSAYRYGKMWRSYRSITGVLTDNNDNYTERYTATPPQHETVHADYTLLDASFDTSFIHHDVTFGMTNYFYHYTRGTDVIKVLGTSNINSPAVFADPKLATGSVNTLQDQPARNIVLGDRIRVNSRILALAGVNYAGLKQEGWGTALTTTHFSQHAFTPSVGVIFKPANTISTYFSYMQGLAAGGSAPSTATNAYQYLGPSINEQYEFGAKSELPRAKLTAALFRINAVNEYTDPRDNVYKKDGVEVHQGVELSGAGKITERLTATGGIMLMRARVDRALNNTSIQGKIPSNVPEQQVRGNFEYRVPHTASLTPTFGVNYSGRRPVDATDAHFIQGATVFDAGLRYQPTIYGHRLTLNANVSNIGNKAYWTYYGLLLGEPRVVAFSIKGQW